MPYQVPRKIPHEICVDVPYKKCHGVPEKVAKKIPRKVSHQVTSNLFNGIWNASCRFVKRSMVTQPMASVTDMECSVDLVLTVGSLGKEVT